MFPAPHAPMQEKYPLPHSRISAPKAHYNGFALFYQGGIVGMWLVCAASSGVGILYPAPLLLSQRSASPEGRECPVSRPHGRTVEKSSMEVNL